jgi:hypothetical protein
MWRDCSRSPICRGFALHTSHAPFFGCAFASTPRPRVSQTRAGVGAARGAWQPLAAEQLFFAALAPTLNRRTALATGNTFAALLGFDRSGLGEAIVEGLGCAHQTRTSTAG